MRARTHTTNRQCFRRRGLRFEKLEQRTLLSVVPAGVEFQVNTFTTSNQGGQIPHSVAMDSDGDFVVVWSSSGQDGAFLGIFARRYNAAGVAQGSEFQVNTFTTGNQDRPSVAMEANGDFVVVWHDGQEGSQGIYGRRYNASGVALGGEFHVNTFTTGNQQTPSIAMDSDGDFVVAWGSGGGQDGDLYGIYARRYNASGTPQGSEFRVNTHTTGNQFAPEAAMDGNGDFVVVWESAHDGHFLGVFWKALQCLGHCPGK